MKAESLNALYSQEEPEDIQLEAERLMGVTDPEGVDAERADDGVRRWALLWEGEFFGAGGVRANASNPGSTTRKTDQLVEPIRYHQIFDFHAPPSLIPSNSFCFGLRYTGG